MAIITVYHRDGRKERQTVGYGGGLCQRAAAPYEQREVPGQMKKTVTPEAYQEPAVAPQAVGTEQKVG